MRVVAIVPARDEEATIGAVVRGLLAHADRVVVCDNASRDRTAEVAAEAGAAVVREAAPGYGAACLAALAEADDADAFLFCDADGSSDPGEAPRLLDALQGGADLAIGVRSRVAPGAMTPPQRFGTWLATALVRLLWRVPCADLGPFRAIRRGPYRRLAMRDRTWGWTVEMQIRAAEEGIRVDEVPVSFLPRAGGRSKISGTVSGVVRAGGRILWTIFGYRLRCGRRARWAASLGGTAALLAILVAVVAAVPLSSSSFSAPPAPLRGVALSLHPAHGADPVRAVGEIADLGAGAIEIVVPYWQSDTRALRPAAHPLRSPRPAAVRGTIRAARTRNLRVWILPIVLLESPGADEWRGVISPADTAAWWSAYRSLVLDLARVAEEEGAEGLAVGSELLSREEETAEWRRLIAEVRGVFRGRLTYSANWDHYEVPAFWRDLDAVGVSSYYEIGSRGDEDADLREAWSRERARLLDFARRTGRPLLLTEVGYPALPSGLAKPWDHTAPGPEDAMVQARGLAAFADVWGDAPPDLAGAFVYEWDDPSIPSAYSPRGRTAEGVLRAWLGNRRALLASDVGVPEVAR